MAKIYTIKEIADIDLRKLGILNMFYIDVEGYTYRGLSNGTLFKYAKCDEVSVTPTTTLPVDNVCEGLSTLDQRTFGLAALHFSKNFVSWENEWIPDTVYNENDMVRDGAWTMVANKDTDDRPAPQTVGNPTFLYPDNPAWNNLSFTGLVETGFRVFDLLDSFLVTAYRVWIPDLSADAHYRVVAIDNITGEIDAREIFNGDIFGSIGWHEIQISPTFVGPGDDFTFVLQAQTFSSTTVLSNPFVYIGSSNQENDPLDGNCERTNNQTGFRVSNTDRNDVDVTADNNAVIPGTILRVDQDSNPLNFLEYEVVVAIDLGTYFFYNVALLNVGVSEPATFSNVTVTYTIPIAAPTKYVELPNFLSNFNNVDGVLRFDEGPIITNQDGNGIDVFLTQYTTSPDWDLVAVSDTGGGGFDSQVEVFTEGISTTIVDSGQSYVLNAAGTLFDNDAFVVIDATRYGVQLGHGNFDVAGSFYDFSDIFQPCQVIFKCVYDPNNNGDMGIELRAYSDKTDIPASLVQTQTSGYKVIKGGNDNEITLAFLYPPQFIVFEAIQVFGVSAVNETVTLGNFTIFINKLKQ